ncbi:DUF1282 domain-containing protein [Puteibacter caeruleilacunae]|nr:DUF1282 domain-containing protein [Puteibacter caeruleilacunae]
MKIKEILKELFFNSKEILITPKEKWEKVAAEDSPQVANNVVYPFLILIAVTSILGGFIYTSWETLDMEFVVMKGVRDFLAAFILFRLTAWVLEQVTPAFDGKKIKSKAQVLIGFTLVPSFIATILEAILPGVYILNLAHLYSFYLLYTGVPFFYTIPEQKKRGFQLVSLLMMFLVYSFINYILWNVLHFFFVSL